MLNGAVMDIFRSKIEVKSSKSFCRGNFLFVPFNALFYVWTMRQCLKNIPAKFQSRPAFLVGFFSKRVTDDDDRRKTFFLASCSEYSSLIYRVVTMEYRTGGRGAVHALPVVRTPRAFCSCRSTNKFLDFSLCFLSFELLCLTMSSPSDFSFKVKEQLFEQTFCTWSFLFEASQLSTRCGKVRVQSQHRRSSSHELLFPSRQTVMHTDHVLTVHKEW